MKLPLSIEDISEMLPHRYPFLFLDRITEFKDGEYVRGRKCVSANEHFFVGHFPDRPIMPGVVMLEALAQLGVIFAKLTTDGMRPDQLCVLAGVESVRFRRPVVPGDVLELEMALVKRRASHWKMRGTGKVDGELAIEAVLMASEARERA
ncbi:MAG: 3-hydroxyacyl-ACP dehydratase FabZ [Bdellovibrionales bacterium]|nr:3-hydroxyacyl-ACP dehydratase FabZ [Bdellovibrionales bacterium]